MNGNPRRRFGTIYDSRLIAKMKQGLLFETMSVRDLRVYADALDGSVSHYLDASGLECDAVTAFEMFQRFGLATDAVHPQILRYLRMRHRPGRVAVNAKW